MKKISAILFLVLAFFIIACNKSSEEVKEQVIQPQNNTQALKSVRRVAHTFAFYDTSGNEKNEQLSRGEVSLLMDIKNNTSKTINKVTLKTTDVQFNELSKIDQKYAKEAKDLITKNIGQKVWLNTNIQANTVIEKNFNLYVIGFGNIVDAELQKKLENEILNFNYVNIFNTFSFRIANLTKENIQNAFENNGIYILLVKSLDIEIEYSYSDGTSSVEKKTLNFDNKVYKIFTTGIIENGIYTVNTSNKYSADKIENYL